MSCCGKTRSQIRATISNQSTNRVPSAAASLPASNGQSVYFQYYGKTGMTVTGPVSSRTYRFSAGETAIAVDARDAPSLARVPNLRAVRRF